MNSTSTPTDVRLMAVIALTHHRTECVGHLERAAQLADVPATGDEVPLKVFLQDFWNARLAEIDKALAFFKS